MTSAPTLTQLLHTRYPDVESEKAELKRWAAPTLTSEKLWTRSAGMPGLAANTPTIPPSRIATLEQLFHYRAVVPPLGKATLALLAIFFCLLRPDVFWGKSPLPFVSLIVLTVLAANSKGFPFLITLWQRRHNRRVGVWLAWFGSSEALPYLATLLRKVPRTRKGKRWHTQAELALADLLDMLDGRPVSPRQLRELQRLLAPAFVNRKHNTRQDVTETRATLCISILRFLNRTGNSRLFARVASDTMTVANQKAMPNCALVQELARVYLDGTEPQATQMALPVAAPPALQMRR